MYGYEDLKDKELMYKVIKRRDNGEVLVSVRNDLSPFVESINVQVDLIEYGKLIREMCLGEITTNSDFIDVFIEDITTLKLFELMVKDPLVPSDSIFKNEYDKLELDNSGVSRFGFILNKRKILDRILNELVTKFDEFIVIEEREPKPQYNPMLMPYPMQQPPMNFDPSNRCLDNHKENIKKLKLPELEGEDDEE